MPSFIDIVRNRAAPGILIFTADLRLVYTNKEALTVVPGLRRREIASEILDLCAAVKKGRKSRAGENCAVLGEAGAVPCALRAFWIDRCTYIMVLAEKIVEKHMNDIDFEKLGKTHRLTSREVEVLRLICLGKANKEIAGSLFVSEYTVKDHIKNIMRKMGQESRSGLIASALRF